MTYTPKYDDVRIQGWAESRDEKFSMKQYYDYREDQIHIRDMLQAWQENVATYTYDFGDSWVHYMILEAISPETLAKSLLSRLNEPICIGGKRAGPPEDAGGSDGYMEKLKALKHPRSKKNREDLEWLGNFEPDYVNIPLINDLNLEEFTQRNFNMDQALDYIFKNQRQEAEQFLLQIDQKDSMDMQTTMVHSDNLMGLHKDQENIDLLKKAIIQHPNNCAILYKIGLSLEKIDHPDEAYQYFMKVMQIDPTYIRNKQILRRIKQDNPELIKEPFITPEDFLTGPSESSKTSQTLAMDPELKTGRNWLAYLIASQLFGILRVLFSMWNYLTANPAKLISKIIPLANGLLGNYPYMPTLPNRLLVSQKWITQSFSDAPSLVLDCLQDNLKFALKDALDEFRKQFH